MADEVDGRVAAELVRRAIHQSLEELAGEVSDEKYSLCWPSSGDFTTEGGQRAIEKTVKVCFAIPSSFSYHV